MDLCQLGGWFELGRGGRWRFFIYNHGHLGESVGYCSYHYERGGPAPIFYYIRGGGSAAVFSHCRGGAPSPL